MIRFLTSSPTPVWPRDSVGLTSLKVIGLCWFLGFVAAFLSVMGD